MSIPKIAKYEANAEGRGCHVCKLFLGEAALASRYHYFIHDHSGDRLGAHNVDMTTQK